MSNRELYSVLRTTASHLYPEARSSQSAAPSKSSLRVSARDHEGLQPGLTIGNQWERILHACHALRRSFGRGDDVFRCVEKHASPVKHAAVGTGTAGCSCMCDSTHAWPLTISPCEVVTTFDSTISRQRPSGVSMQWPEACNTFGEEMRVRQGDLHVPLHWVSETAAFNSRRTTCPRGSSNC